MRVMLSEESKSSHGWFFQVWSWAAVFVAILVLNTPLFTFINGISWPPLDWAMLSLTELGNGAAAAMIVLLLSPFRRDLTLRAAGAMILAGIISSLIKDTLALPRPPALLGDTVRVLGVRMMGESFPSGHTTTVFALAFALKGAVDRPVFRASLIAASLVGVSRVYIGAHFPIDAAAGAFLGWACAAITVRPMDSFARRLDGLRPWLDRSFLLLAAVCAVYLALFEPMIRYNPWFLRLFGFGGLTASIFLLGKTMGLGKGGR